MKQLSANNRTPGFAKLVLSILAFAGIFVAEVVAFFLVLALDIPDDSLWSQILPECFGAAAAVVGMVALGGRSCLQPKKGAIAYTFRFGWWCMAISVGLAVWDQCSYLAEGVSVEAGWPMRLVECTIFCLAIGVLEELMYRGLILNGLLAVMGDTHKGVVRAVLITSVAFGMAHVDFTTDFVDGLSAVQALLKIVQTGMYSIMLCTIVLKTRELVGVSLFHGLDDFVILAPSVVLYRESVDVDYVSTGEDAVPIIIYYLVIIALYLPFVIKSLVVLRKSQVVWSGAFMEDDAGEGGATIAQAAPQVPGGLATDNAPAVPGGLAPSYAPVPPGGTAASSSGTAGRGGTPPAPPGFAS